MTRAHILLATVILSSFGAHAARANDAVAAGQMPARSARVEPHDRADTPMRLGRRNTDLRATVVASAQPVAAACDSILCPSYTMMGVGF